MKKKKKSSGKKEDEKSSGLFYLWTYLVLFVYLPCTEKGKKFYTKTKPTKKKKKNLSFPNQTLDYEL